MRFGSLGCKRRLRDLVEMNQRKMSMSFIKYVMSLVLIMALAACGGGGGNPGTPSGSPVVLAPLFTTAPASLTVGVGSASDFNISGGSSPYTAVSNNAAIAIAGVKGSVLTLGGVAEGAAEISVRDSAGRTVTVAMIVSNGKARPLFTSAPASVTVAIGASPAYSVGGGTAPYMATSDNTGIASVSLLGSNLTVTGARVGSANIVVRDSVGASVTVNVTVGTVALVVTPNTATGIIDDVLIASITGGTAPYRASVGNVSIASAVVQNANELKITLLQVGQTIVTVLDANNQSIAYSLTSNAATPGIRFSPNAVTVSEFGNEPIFFTVYGAAPGVMNVFSSDITRLTATLVGQLVTVTTGTNNNRCVGGSTEVRITVVDSTRATGVAVVTIQENGGTCP